ncbi:IQ domain-containing protein K, partial [Meleagris gallopavo]|uniref:IQ domain-containing protein K n=1 Tax=Meleagris gallopavo TaxID=9103 RepID=UPI0012ABACB6
RSADLEYSVSQGPLCCVTQEGLVSLSDSLPFLSTKQNSIRFQTSPSQHRNLTSEEDRICSPQEYLEYYIFPVLLPGMTELLHQAKKEKCFERKRTKFIACDFLTEWLYNHNPRRKDESFTEFFSIPFVHDWLKDHPREPLPLSFFLSEEEASVIIQAFWRGYRVRCDREVQELRQWQKQLRDEKIIFQRVEEFWARQEAKAIICAFNIATSVP